MAVILGMFGTVQFRFRYLIFVSQPPADVTELDFASVNFNTPSSGLAVRSMAGPLGGLELLHHLFLPGGRKPVSGTLRVFYFPMIPK